MGLVSSIATTFNTPLLSGGPASVVWCWILGTCMCLTLGASIAEIVSAYPTCEFLIRFDDGDLSLMLFTQVVDCEIRFLIYIRIVPDLDRARYTASAQLCPKKHRAIVGWVVGWMNILGQLALSN